MTKEEKIPIHFETDKEHYARIQNLMNEKGWSLKETLHYFMDGKVEETCACESCDWYDGFDSKRDIPRCLNRHPPIDKKFLSRTSGDICYKMKEEQRLLEAMQRRTILTPLFLKLYWDKRGRPTTLEGATNTFKSLLCYDHENLKKWEALIMNALS